MLDLLPHLDTWRPAASGQRCAVATVVGTSGSVPRPVGTSMLVSETGEVLGSLSGGCVEGAVVESALESMRDGGTRREFFGYSDEDAFAAGLTCGGGLEVHIEPLGPGPGWLLLESLHGLAGRHPGSGAALIRRVDGGGSGAVVVPDPATFHVLQSAELAALLGTEPPGAGLPGSAGSVGSVGSAGAGMLLAAAAQLEPLLRGGRTGLVRLAPAGDCQPEPVSLLVESKLPAARLLIFGANDFGAALLPAAKLLGYHVTLCDARPAFARQDRFGAADEVATAWPHRYLADQVRAGRTDARTAICVLTHDPKFDVPLLQAALGLDLAYVGAMGSRRSHRARIDALRQAGVADQDLARLHSPIGLDLGAVTPEEVAVSIVAELVANRSKAAGLAQGSGSLKDASGPIHQYAPSRPHASIHPHSNHPDSYHPDSSAGMPVRQEAPWT